MAQLVLVGLGGALGAMFRFLMAGFVQARSGSAAFPFGTLAVNVMGCLAIGMLAELFESRGFLGPEARAFLMIGLLGGFTTFSAFGNETVNLFRDGEALLAGLNVAGQVLLCLAAVWLGRVLSALIWR